MAVVMDQAKVNQGAELVSTFLDLREVEIPDYENGLNKIAPLPRDWCETGRP